MSKLIEEFSDYRVKMTGVILAQIKRLCNLYTKMCGKVAWMVKKQVARSCGRHGITLRRLYPVSSWQSNRPVLTPRNYMKFLPWPILWGERPLYFVQACGRRLRKLILGHSVK